MTVAQLIEILRNHPHQDDECYVTIYEELAIGPAADSEKDHDTTYILPSFDPSEEGDGLAATVYMKPAWLKRNLGLIP